jgi:hypothetical protein
LKERGKDIKGELKRGESSLMKYLPLPLSKGKGIQGIGLRSNPQIDTYSVTLLEYHLTLLKR